MGTLPDIALRRLADAAGGPLLVVGPSLGTTVDRLWAAVAASLPGWNVVGWDLPGHGHSPAADRLTSGFDMADLAAAVLRAVDAEASGGEAGAAPAFAYAGDSVGGAVGLQLALDHPQRITSLTVLCSAARFGTPEAWRERAALVRAEGMAPMVASSPARWFGPAIVAAGSDLVHAALRDLAAVDAEGYARTCEALATFDVTARLATVSAPVLAVAGADDVATPPELLATIADAVPRGRLDVIPGVGHLAPLEAPDRVASLLSAFLRTG
ncbi:alpha/beta fold hydrolase [Nocardioides albidus]|uniref:Alpha/beta fold hydrolase n=1 Tax=Nocardioides albidus TaxID=1517589 RepID=A0A5C4VQG0_9ACTN|nr:alpha/beta fold hydrolase [Nocardioides albidus]TNM37499.1 alpha/beta fold hydrolase [Nocardioides albidus]